MCDQNDKIDSQRLQGTDHPEKEESQKPTNQLPRNLNQKQLFWTKRTRNE